MQDIRDISYFNYEVNWSIKLITEIISMIIGCTKLHIKPKHYFMFSSKLYLVLVFHECIFLALAGILKDNDIKLLNCQQIC